MSEDTRAAGHVAPAASDTACAAASPASRPERPPAVSDGAAAAGRVRSRLVRFGTRHSPATPGLGPLMQAIRTNHPKADLGIIERAYTVAERAHRGQMRKSGDPYITHPVAVATILAELGMTTATLAAALLHDTVEDTEYSLDQLRKDFGARGRDAGRRRDQARQGQLRRRGAGRDRAQDGRRDGARHPRAGHQARRPAAQRAHLEVRPGGVRRAQGPRDARDLRAAGAPARHEHHQVGARGPVVRDALPQGVRRDRPARRRARARPRGVPRRGARPGRPGPARRRRSRRP